VLLRIGDIWREQRLAERPDYELEAFEGVHVTPSTALCVKAGISLEGGHFLLPLDEHPGHRANTHSYCVVLPLSENRRLVIPCMELIRFYFGSSSSLLTKLFLPPLVRRALYKSADLDPGSRQLALKLAAGISGASAADIGRLHLDHGAWRAAVDVGSAMVRASTGNETIDPQTSFPFEGRTNLRVSGQWVKHGTQPKATFVVFRMHSCSYPFPFRSLRYELATDNTIGGANVERPPDNTGPRAGAADSPDIGFVERDASNTLAPKVQRFWSESRFPDLDRKPVWKLAAEKAAAARAQGGARKGASLDSVAVGAPGSSQRVRPINLEAQSESEDVEGSADEVFLLLTETLAEHHGHENVRILPVEPSMLKGLRDALNSAFRRVIHQIGDQFFFEDASAVKVLGVRMGEYAYQAILIARDAPNLPLSLVALLRFRTVDWSTDCGNFGWLERHHIVTPNDASLAHDIVMKIIEPEESLRSGEVGSLRAMAQAISSYAEQLRGNICLNNEED